MVSAVLLGAGIHIRRYLDDWLIEAVSRAQVRQALNTVFHLCHQLGEVSPTACAKGDLSGHTSGLGEFQGFACPEASRETSLNRRRISILGRAARVFLDRALRGSGFSDSAGAW